MKSKEFKTYKQQVALLEERNLLIEDKAEAEKILKTLSYYRLSGYWYPMRRFDQQTKPEHDSFRTPASFNLVIKLYRFDEKLRHAVLTELTHIELAMRALIGHELGKIEPTIHLKPELLDSSARQPVRRNSNLTKYELWHEKFESALSKSKEDFVKHYQENYDGYLPIWAAVEIMDWGMLSHLFAISPNCAKKTIARQVELSPAQLSSWLKSLNIIRNYCAHHARLFNRNFAIQPKLNKDPKLTAVEKCKNKLFGQLTLAQYLLTTLNLSDATAIPSVLSSFPTNSLVPLERTGAPPEWYNHPLWKLPPNQKIHV